MSRSRRSPRLLTGRAVVLAIATVLVCVLGGALPASAGVTPAITTVGSPPAFTESPPNAVVNTFYNYPFVTTGSTPITYSLQSGTLPHGLTLFTNAIGGFPDVIGPGTSVTIRATNDFGFADLPFTIDVMPKPPTITGTATPTATVGTDYYYRYFANGNPAPTFSITDGLPPDGLTLDSIGELQGTPTTPGSFTFTVTATNGAAPDATDTPTIVVSPVPVSISGTPTPGGVGEPYSFTFGTTGTPAPTVTKTTGNLPPGLSLSQAGVVSGTPKTAGFYVFSVQADNGVDPVKTDDVSLFIDNRPTISVWDSSLHEGNSGTHSLTFDAVLARISTLPVTVHWETRNGTATAGSDYTSSSGNLTFLPGDTFTTFTVPVKGDRVREPNERFYIVLSRPLHGNLPGRRGVGTIINDD